MNKKIYIVTGNIKAGKTTFVEKWIKSKTNVAGIIQPVINGERFIKNISSNNYKKLTTDVINSTTIKIGKYLFDNETFNWAKDQLNEGVKTKPEWLIIDEFGILELDGKGLEPEFTNILNRIKNQDHTKLLVVVREYLLDQFWDKYKLKNDEVDLISVNNENRLE